jgi:hypothetical protein
VGHFWGQIEDLHLCFSSHDSRYNQTKRKGSVLVYRDTVQGEKYTSQTPIDEANGNLAAHHKSVVNFALKNSLEIGGFIPVVFEYRDKCD